MGVEKWKDGNGHIHEYEVGPIGRELDEGVGIYARRAPAGWHRLGFAFSGPTDLPDDRPPSPPPSNATHLHFRRIARRQDRRDALEALAVACCWVP